MGQGQKEYIYFYLHLKLKQDHFPSCSLFTAEEGSIQTHITTSDDKKCGHGVRAAEKRECATVTSPAPA